MLLQYAIAYAHIFAVFTGENFVRGWLWLGLNIFIHDKTWERIGQIKEARFSHLLLYLAWQFVNVHPVFDMLYTLLLSGKILVLFNELFPTLDHGKYAFLSVTTTVAEFDVKLKLVLSSNHKVVFWVKVWLRQKYYAPQVRPDYGSNPWPPDHDSRCHVPETSALTNGLWTHDLQIMTVDFMTLRRPP